MTRPDGPAPLVVHEQEVEAESWDDPTRGTLSFRTLFGGAGTRTGEFTAGGGEPEPREWLALHTHRQAEVYFVVQGRLRLRLGDAEHDLRAGSAVFVPGDVPHGVENVGTTPARIFYVLAAESFDQVEYVFPK
jgi:mannose-6-phosphate isomerase-like protein (cupin superfamily)